MFSPFLCMHIHKLSHACVFVYACRYTEHTDGHLKWTMPIVIFFSSGVNLSVPVVSFHPYTGNRMYEYFSAF